MRIAITGAHGVGKSTLAARISDALGLPELPTPGRTLAARGLPVNETATVSSQLIAWLLQFRLERECANWVASRSLIDVWAYTVLAAARYEQDPVEAALLQELARVTPLTLAGAYNALIYVPVGIALIADEVRSADAAFQRATDEAIRNALSEWSIPHVMIDVRDSDAVTLLAERLAHDAGSERSV